MRSQWFKYFMLVCLLAVYVNRGLFVAMPGTEMFDVQVASGNEVNSLLEIVIEWAGGHNHVDEDGNSPESYNSAKTAQPVINPNQLCSIELERPNVPVYKIFFLFDEAILPLHTYGTIDHPPEMA